MKSRVFLISIFLIILVFRVVPVSKGQISDTDGDGISDQDETNCTYGFCTDPYNSDTDGDGISDYDEIFGTTGYYTNPTLYDTDGDYIPDGLEIYYGTNPTDLASTDDMNLYDSDSDGLTDYQEVINYYTNPLNPDTDGDGLTDGQEVNGYNGFISNPQVMDSDYDGLTDYQEVTGYYGYITDPQVYDSDNDMVSDGDEETYYNTNPLNPDTDGDGNPDGLEVYYYYTDPNNAASYVDMNTSDLDGDGLTDYEEVFGVLGYFTSPVNFDSDSDSFSDYDEIMAGSDPNDYKFVPAWSDVYEPNNDYTQATAIGFGATPDLSIDVIAEQDWFSFTLTVSTDVHLFTSSRNPTDTTMTLYDNTGVTQLAYNDDYWNLMSHIEMILAAGTYYVLIQAYSNDRLINNYRLHLVDTTMDSDGDGMKDYDELLNSHTDPTLVDTDGDGLSDYEEYYAYYGYYSDPNNPDSDGDGVSDGDEVLLYGTDANNDDSDYDGLSDYDELFIYMTNPLYSDSDSDGITDGDEVNYWGTDPNNYDTDADGLSDYDEIYSWGTDPNNFDSDYDGWSDYDEVYAGTNPNDSNSHPVSADAYEPDNTYGDAQQLQQNSDSPMHSFHSSTDVDWFYFDLAQAAQVTIYTHGDAGGDTFLKLLDTSRNVIMSDDNGGSDSYSSITIHLDPGHYYVNVYEYSGDLLGSYYVYLSVQNDAPSTSTSTTQSNNPTSTTSQTSSNPQSSDQNSSSQPSLPVPISMTPVLLSIFGLVFIGYQRRKWH